MDINTKYIIYFLVSAGGIVIINEIIKEYLDYEILYGIIAGLLFCLLSLLKSLDILKKRLEG